MFYINTLAVMLLYSGCSDAPTETQTIVETKTVNSLVPTVVEESGDNCKSGRQFQD